MYQRQKCIAQAAICREKARADSAHHDYWIDEAIGWLQRAIPTGHKNAVTHEVRDGRLIPKTPKDEPKDKPSRTGQARQIVEQYATTSARLSRS